MPQIMGMVSQGSTISDLMVSAGFLHVWPLRETSGTTATDVGSDPINGEYLNEFTLYGDQGVQLLGDGGGGGTYNGAVRLPTDAFSEIGSTNDWTLMGVFKPTVSPSGYSIISCVEASGWSQPMQIDYHSGGTIRLRYGTGAFAEQTVGDTVEALTLNEYNHIAVVNYYIDSSTIRTNIFVNGVRLECNSHGKNRAFSARDGYIGSRNGEAGQGASSGYYRDWGIADYPLTEAEVNAFYGCMDG